MSDSKMMSLLPNSPIHPLIDGAERSPVTMEDKLAMHASRISNLPGTTSSNISPKPTHQNTKIMSGLLLTPVPGRLTPTGQGRIKAAPVCRSPTLKRAASSIDEFTTEGVCFSPKEAGSCAEKAFAKSGNCVEDRPLNVEMCDASFSWKDHTANLAPPKLTAAALALLSEGKAHISSSSTVVTNYSSSSSSCRSVMGNDVAEVAVKTSPPLEVIQTDLAVNAGDEHMAGTPQRSVATASEASSTSLSTTFTKSLVKANLSRQGRSLQRWLFHSPTEELVRQVAGTIPITRDGRIILVSASRKTEWILPKGGWDEDETKDECAARETFEEAGLLGQLGGCLEPIDYETNKAKKRRLSKQEDGEKKKFKVDGGKAEGSKRTVSEGLRPPLPKRVKTDDGSPTGPELTSSPAKNSGLLGSMCGSGEKGFKNMTPKSTSATASSESPKYSYVRLSLFPLYVSEVKSDWPEKGRLRKLVDIDEAIEIMKVENRPYFLRGLEMLKERGLHLVKP